MVVIIALMIVVAVAGAFIIGRAAGSNGSSPTVPAPNRDGGSSECDKVGAEWDNARQMACNAKSDEAAARNRVENARSQLAVAIATAVSLGTAAAATFVAAAAATATIFGIPAGIVLTGIAIGLVAAAAAATLLVIAWTGALTAADDDLAQKSRARNQWETEVARLRAAINANCPPEKANSFLGRPGPC